MAGLGLETLGWPYSRLNVMSALYGGWRKRAGGDVRLLASKWLMNC